MLTVRHTSSHTKYITKLYLFIFVGFFIVVILAYFLKDFVSEILYQFVPFLTFSGDLAGVTVLNILMYEVISFLLVYFILMAVYHFVVRITGIVETICSRTSGRIARTISVPI